MASSILVPHNTFPREKREERKTKKYGTGFPKEQKGKKERKKMVELDFTVKGNCAACGQFCWNHLQSMKQEFCFF